MCVLVDADKNRGHGVDKNFRLPMRRLQGLPLVTQAGGHLADHATGGEKRNRTCHSHSRYEYGQGNPASRGVAFLTLTGCQFKLISLEAHEFIPGSVVFEQS